MTAKAFILGLPEEASKHDLTGIETLFHFDLKSDNSGTYSVKVSNGVVTANEGLEGEPKCVITTKGETLIGLVKGEINPMMALLTGKVKISNQNELIKYICLLLEEGHKVKDVVEELPLSIRPLQKLFKSSTGLSMKQYQDIARIRKTTIDLYTAQKDRYDILYTNGFFDQSHFINDFKRRMDRSPKDFLNYHNSFEIDLG